MSQYTLFGKDYIVDMLPKLNLTFLNVIILFNNRGGGVFNSRQALYENHLDVYDWPIYCNNLYIFIV